jgi:hypothetical protein
MGFVEIPAKRRFPPGDRAYRAAGAPQQTVVEFIQGPGPLGQLGEQPMIGPLLAENRRPSPRQRSLAATIDHVALARRERTIASRSLSAAARAVAPSFRAA